MLELVTNFFSVYPVPETFADFVPYVMILLIELMIVLGVFKLIGYVFSSLITIGSGGNRL